MSVCKFSLNALLLKQSAHKGWKKGGETFYVGQYLFFEKLEPMAELNDYAFFPRTYMKSLTQKKLLFCVKLFLYNEMAFSFSTVTL